jgi:raffinose/stachyose/melibiose transport system substrate-binding protein
MRISRIAAALAALALAASLSACGGGGDSPKSSDGSGELTFFSWDNQETMTPLIKAFEAKNPKIKIKFSYAPPVQEYQDTLQKRLLAGQAADVFILGNKKEQAGGGYVKDLSRLPVISALSPFNLKMYSYKGKPYGVSVASWGGGLLVNLDLMAKIGVTKAPSTWDELLTTLAKVKAAGIRPMLEPSDGISTTIMAKIGQADAANGGLDEKIYDGQTTFSKAWTQPLQQWSELYTRGLVSKDAAGLKGDQVQTEFVAGRVAMIATGSWAVGAVKQGAPKMHFTFWPVPGESPGEDFWAGAASPAYAINSKAKNPVAAEKWVNFLGGSEGAKIYHDTTGSITTTSNYSPGLDPSLQAMYKDVVAGKVWCTWQAWPGASTSALDATMLTHVQATILGRERAADVTSALDQKYAALK